MTSSRSGIASGLIVLINVTGNSLHWLTTDWLPEPKNLLRRQSTENKSCESQKAARVTCGYVHAPDLASFVPSPSCQDDVSSVGLMRIRAHPLAELIHVAEVEMHKLTLALQTNEIHQCRSDLRNVLYANRRQVWVRTPSFLHMSVYFRYT